jgi:type IV secretory pathway VirB4 component
MPLFSLRRRDAPGRVAGPDPDAAETARFARGARGLADLVNPSEVEVGRDWLRIDDEYTRTLFIANLPHAVGPGWLSDLIVFEEPLTLSIHMVPFDSQRMVRRLDGYLTRLQTARRLRARDERLDDPELESDFRKTQRLQAALQSGDERVFTAGHYILLRAGSPAELDALTDRIMGIGENMGAQIRVARREQDSGFRSCLPIGQDHLRLGQNLDASALGLGFPFTAGTMSMEGGIVLGRAPQSSLVIWDPFDARLENYNLTVVAMSGAGKSFFVKVMASRLMAALGVEFIIVDPEAKEEYRPLCAAVGGRYVRLAPGAAEAINPFDIPPPPPREVDEEERREARDRLAEAAGSVLGLLEIMLAEPGGSLTTRERTVLTRAVYATYEAAGIRRGDEATWDRTPPLLRDLHATLGQFRADDLIGPVAGDLALRLEAYIEGPLAGFFDRQTSLGLDRRMIVFNLFALASDDDPRPLAIGIHLITRFVWGQVRHSVVPRMLIVDEAWTLLQGGAGGRFLAGMARRARKYFLSLVTISTVVTDFLGSEHGNVIFNNSAMKLILKQDANSIPAIGANVPLTRRECLDLVNAEQGAGFFFARNGHTWLKLEPSPKEYRMATTAPRDLIALEAERAAERDAARPGDAGRTFADN